MGQEPAAGTAVREEGRRVPPLILLLFAIEAFFAIAFLVLHSTPAPSRALEAWFHIGLESSLPTWFSSMQLALVGLLFLTFFLHEQRKGVRAWGLLLSAGLFFFLSADEAAQVHELLSGIFNRRVLHTSIPETAFKRTGYWMFLLTPLLLAGLWVCWRLIRPYLQGHRAQRKLVIGVFVFVASATIPEVFYNFLSGNAQAAEQVIEEVGEMAGITIVLWGVLDLLAAHRVHLDFRY